MRRRVGFILVFGAALPLTIASVAWACGVLATVQVDKRVAAPGETVTVTGSNWGTREGNSAVTIRLSTRDGQVLATTPALPGGKINETIALPRSLSPGWYILVGTQTNADGTPKAGTPGRTNLRIQGSAAAAGAAASPWGAGDPSAPAASAAGAGGGQSLLAILLAGGLSLTMLAGGWKLLSRRSSTVGQPQLGI